MTALESFVSAVEAYSGVQALIGNGDSPETYRFYHGIADAGVTKPYSVYTLVSNVRPQQLDGNNTRQNLRIRVACYGTTVASALGLSDQIRAAIDAATAFVGSQILEVVNREPDTDLLQVVSDYSIWY